MNRPAAILAQLETSLSASPESLAQRFGVSLRTITADVAHLNQLLGPAGSIRLDGGRYRLLVVDPGRFGQVRERIVGERESFSDADWRLGFILARLYRSTVPVRTEELAQAMSVGRTMVVSDLGHLRNLLAPYGLTVEGRTHVGLSLRGPELGVRSAVLRYAYRAAYAGFDLGEELESALREIAVEHGLGDDLASSLLRWFTVMLDRHFGGHALTELPGVYDSLVGSPAHAFAWSVAARVRPLLLEDLPEAEVLFLALPAAGMRTPIDLASLPELLSPLPSEELIQAVFDRIRTEMDLDIDPAELLPEFSHHVAFMLNRMRYSLPIGGTLSPDQVRLEYPLAYRMAAIARDVIAERTDLVMDDNEVALAATYFQVFLEQHAVRRQAPLRVAIVTGQSPARARLIQAQLAKVLPATTQYALSTPGEAGSLGDVDLMVLTAGVRLDTPLPTLELAEVFDRAELVGKLSLLRFPRRGPLTLAGASRSPLVTLLAEDRFVRLPPQVDYLDGVGRLVGVLHRQGVVGDSFAQALAEREAQATMRLNEYVAFPHTVAAGGQELGCALGVIPRADHEPGLRLIFLMAVPDKASYDDTILIRVYDEVIRLGSDPGLVSKISRLTTYEQFFYLMENAATGPHN